MYPVSEQYANKIISDDRAFSIRLTLGSTELTGTTIQNITLDELVNSTETLTMGCACSNKITINLINPPTDISYDGVSFIVEVGLKVSDIYEYIPLGKFYGAVPETNNDFKNLKLVAYDGFCKMTGAYESTVPDDTTLQAVYDDLKAQLHSKCGITLKAMELPDYPITFPRIENITYTQAIGYVAGCLGGFARFDRNGELEIAWYSETGYEIRRAMQYMNGLSRTTDKALVITSISTGTQDNPIIRGDGVNGTAISFENPYMTDAMADDIFTSVNGLTYTPCKVRWRGNPAIQAGDIVRAIDKNGISHKVLIMSQSIKIGGGCNSTIECKGTTDTTSEFSNKFETTSQKIERYYSTLQEAILNATNAITGNKGGYVILHDTNNDGHPDEILIMDTEDIVSATKVWRWNKEGLGYASNPNGNAYLGSYALAITANGQINADFITTGTLNANRIAVESYDGKSGLLTDYIRFEDGSMTFGKADNAITLKLENNQVAFYSGDKRIAWFTNNSFEIENLTEGKIRFQNFGFIPRKSGNLTFTLLT